MLQAASSAGAAVESNVKYCCLSVLFSGVKIIYIYYYCKNLNQLNVLKIVSIQLKEYY